MIACECPVCTSNNLKDNRLRCSVLVESATTTFVIDTGPDFREQMLRYKVKKLDAVLFTHPHKDHVAGLDDVKAYNFFQKKAMELYANSLTEEALRREFYYAFSDTKYPGVPELILNTITEEPFYIGDIPVIPIMVWHLKMPVFGFRIGKLTYITDVNRIEEHEMNKIKGSEVLVVSALRKQSHISHFTLGEAIELVQQLKVPTGYFTHLSHQMGLHDEVESELPSGIHLAYDGLQFQFDKASN